VTSYNEREASYTVDINWLYPRASIPTPWTGWVGIKEKSYTPRWKLNVNSGLISDEIDTYHNKIWDKTHSDHCRFYTFFIKIAFSYKPHHPLWKVKQSAVNVMAGVIDIWITTVWFTQSMRINVTLGVLPRLISTLIYIFIKARYHLDSTLKWVET
jgi:hypothetical protein